MANVENKATKSCTPIYEQMDRPKPGKEGGYGNGANSSSPAYCNFFWVEKFVSKNQQFLPVWLRKNELDKLKKKIEILFRAYFFLGKRGEGDSRAKKRTEGETENAGMASVHKSINIRQAFRKKMDCRRRPGRIGHE